MATKLNLQEQAGQGGIRMIEKVNPSHPDKVADRIAGALVDYAYKVTDYPRIAVEVLIGHGVCHVIAETSVPIPDAVIRSVVSRITGVDGVEIDYREVPQDPHLADNQSDGVKCGDNGIFKGVPLTLEQKDISRIVRSLYDEYPTDGKFIMTDDKFIACQSCADDKELTGRIAKGIAACGRNPFGYQIIVNPLGSWTGGTDVDTGATNRKLGSDMGDAVTGGGLHGKDLSKADVAVNVYAHLLAQKTGEVVSLNCAIGDSEVDGVPYADIVRIARDYIFDTVGGFEKLAEWGLF